MRMPYSFAKKLDLQLDRIEAAVTMDADNEAELVALRAEVAALVAAGKVSAEEKAAMDERVKAALARSETTEARLRSAVPTV